jgi:hypothetical protein
MAMLLAVPYSFWSQLVAVAAPPDAQAAAEAVRAALESEAVPVALLPEAAGLRLQMTELMHSCK